MENALTRKKEQEKLFQQLKLLCPIFSDKASVLAEGYQSLTIDMGDGTVAKAFKVLPTDQRQNIERNIVCEVASLRHFDGQVGDFQSPRLVTEPILFRADEPAGEDYVGLVQMSKIKGCGADWQKLLTSATAGEQLSHSHQLGHLIAAIHDIGDKMDKPPMSSVVRGHIIDIYTIDDPDVRGRLGMVNRWFAAQPKDGYAHADINQNNVMVNDKGRITGVLDFAYAGHNVNRYSDLMNFAPPLLADLYDGYTAGTGRDIDPLLVEVTAMSWFSDCISWIKENPNKVPFGDLEDQQKVMLRQLTAVERNLGL